MQFPQYFGSSAPSAARICLWQILPLCSSMFVGIAHFSYKSKCIFKGICINGQQSRRKRHGCDFIHIDKMPFAAEEQLYSEAVKEFISRRKSGTLPEIRPITKYSEEAEQKEDEKPDPEQQLIQLFGSDLVQIIDEGGK